MIATSNMQRCLSQETLERQQNHYKKDVSRVTDMKKHMTLGVMATDELVEISRKGDQLSTSFGIENLGNEVSQYITEVPS